MIEATMEVVLTPELEACGQKIANYFSQSLKDLNGLIKKGEKPTDDRFHLRVADSKSRALVRDFIEGADKLAGLNPDSLENLEVLEMYGYAYDRYALAFRLLERGELVASQELASQANGACLKLLATLSKISPEIFGSVK